MKRSIGYLIPWLLVVAAASRISGQSTETAIDRRNLLLPRYLLPLLHAPEVQAELELGAEQTKSLQQLFADIDGPWWRARNLPEPERVALVKQLEARVQAWLEAHVPLPKQERLRQLERQAQGIRALLRADVADRLGLTNEQQAELLHLAEATTSAQQRLMNAKMQGESTEELEKTARAALDVENKALRTVLTSDQIPRLGPILGAEFDTKGLDRIYPMAPEFADGDRWLHSEPMTMRSLRGKIVLIHFYAFQCHNCHANFDHYRRWHDELARHGVVVIGIQTPETPTERDAEEVKLAAQAKGLEFPIVLDMKSENWNAWGNTMWPTVYVVDQDGYIRSWWQGELNWNGATGDKSIESLIEKLRTNESTAAS